MKPLGYAPEALDDLDAITRYIARDNPDRADSFRLELEKRAQAAADRPLSFRLRPNVGPNLRAVNHGDYLLFYRDLPHEVRIVRVVHSARDLGAIFSA